MIGRIILLLVLILINGFFSAVEISFLTLNDAKIDLLAKDGNKKAKKIKNMLENPSNFLSTIQIGITLAGFLSSAFASEAFATYLAPALYSLIPVISLSVWNTISIVIITIILSYFSLILGELVPKRIGMKYYEKIAFATVGFINGLSTFISPFVKLLSTSTNAVSKLFGVPATVEDNVTEEEIRMMVDAGQENGTIEENEGEMIDNIFEFNDKVVSEIMVPRNDVYAIDMNMSIGDVIKKIENDKNFTYSRFPVYDGTIDSIEGIVHIKDILLSNNKKDMKIRTLATEPYFVPETKDVDEVFYDMRKNQKQIAVVLDEYGGTSGIVTMEDMLEEIVGEIYDEYDKVEETYKKVSDDIYILKGIMPIYEVEKTLNIKIPDGDYDTISGYLIELLDRIPDEDENPEVETDDVLYKIKKVEDRRIIEIEAHKKKKLQTEDEDDDKII